MLTNILNAVSTVILLAISAVLLSHAMIQPNGVFLYITGLSALFAGILVAKL